MDGGRAKARERLEREVFGLLSRWDDGLVERIDLLLADCAAEALRISLERRRADRNLEALLSSTQASGFAAGLGTELFVRRRQLSIEWKRICELMRGLRAHRDRVVRSYSSNGH
jgi:hypothetical protein